MQQSCHWCKIKVTFEENGIEKGQYSHDVNSGGSFGSNPLMQHIGISGNAAQIECIQIKWPVSNAVQAFSPGNA